MNLLPRFSFCQKKKALTESVETPIGQYTTLVSSCPVMRSYCGQIIWPALSLFWCFSLLTSQIFILFYDVVSLLSYIQWRGGNFLSFSLFFSFPPFFPSHIAVMLSPSCCCCRILLEGTIEIDAANWCCSSIDSNSNGIGDTARVSWVCSRWMLMFLRNLFWI